jgi:hypothetical protein
MRKDSVFFKQHAFLIFVEDFPKHHVNVTTTTVSTYNQTKHYSLTLLDVGIQTVTHSEHCALCPLLLREKKAPRANPRR